MYCVTEHTVCNTFQESEVYINAQRKSSLLPTPKVRRSGFLLHWEVDQCGKDWFWLFWVPYPCHCSTPVCYLSQFDHLTLRRGTEDALAIEPLRLAARCFSRSHLYSNWGRGSSGGLGTSTPALPISRTDTRRHFLSSSSVNTTILFTHWPLRCNNT